MSAALPVQPYIAHLNAGQLNVRFAACQSVPTVLVPWALTTAVKLAPHGDVICAITAGQKQVPYRNHKLTQLMADSLGGNAKTLMFVNISPADDNFGETEGSLRYASRVKKVTNNATKAVETATIKALREQIAALKAGK